jgi:hypothetical protein
VAHASNPSYSGGRNQDDHDLKAQANSSREPILKISIKKRAGGVAQGEGPEFKPQYHKKKKKLPSQNINFFFQYWGLNLGSHVC